MSSFFYCQDELRNLVPKFASEVENFAKENYLQVYIIDKPLADNKYSYKSKKSLVVLVPNHKLMFLNFGDSEDQFNDFIEDFLEDLGSISDKFEYKETIGRPRTWRSEVVYEPDFPVNDGEVDVSDLLDENKLVSPKLRKKSELLISLLTGSINDIKKVKESIPDNILDKIKQKIILFDGDQTRFVYQDTNVDKVTIQGLSGTGKTELLLHKLKETYVSTKTSKILFTCHNKILAANIKNRIPDFFNFMKVEQQIKWNERLWCVHAWGSEKDYHSGAYSYICRKYRIPFLQFSYSMPFSKACSLALEHLKDRDISEEGYAFDYVFIDESQDFPLEFIRLCQLVTSKTVYVAGDIFQSIFDETILSEVQPDFLLSKCYRTDPRTLMFAHALGMGLFEKDKLRWLKDKEWDACGYSVEKDGRNYKLTREPLRRFEDLNADKIISMNLVEVGNNSHTKTDHEAVIEIIEKIINENPTVQPEDIGIVFTGNNKVGFTLADILQFKIQKKFGWSLNKAWETKQKVVNSVFISNKNNVKGLEFPFVICVSKSISNALHERNALYMLLTRSFIQSYLIVSDSSPQDKLGSIKDGLSYINRNGCIQTVAPTASEQERIMTRITINKKQKDLQELILNVFEELDVPEDYRPIFNNLISKMKNKTITYENVRKLVEANLEAVEQK